MKCPVCGSTKVESHPVQPVRHGGPNATDHYSCERCGVMFYSTEHDEKPESFISKRALDMMDKSIENYKKGIAGKPVEAEKMGDTAESLLREIVELVAPDEKGYYNSGAYRVYSPNSPYIRAKKLLEQYDKWDKAADDDINDLLMCKDCAHYGHGATKACYGCDGRKNYEPAPNRKG